MDLKTNSIPQATPYTHPLEKKGLEAVLILNDSGLPIYGRNYSEKGLDSHEDVVLSAFISSLSNFVKIYDSEILNGFSTNQNKFFMKSEDDVIYCFVLNNNIFNLAKGLELTDVLTITLNELIKSFSVYYKMTKLNDFTEKNFLDAFEKQIDILLTFNLKKNSTIQKNSTFSPKKFIENEFIEGSFNHTFLKFGILGLIILDDQNNPIIVRDYSIKRKYNKGIDYYQRIVLTLKQFGNSKFDVLTDIGIGENRIVLKEIINFTVCFIIAEENYWNYDNQKLNSLVNILSKDMDFQLQQSAKFTYDFSHRIIKSESVHSISYKIDQLLHVNLLKFTKNST